MSEFPISLNKNVEYVVKSSDYHNYSQLRCNLPSPHTTYSALTVTTLTTIFNINILTKSSKIYLLRVRKGYFNYQDEDLEDLIYRYEKPDPEDPRLPLTMSRIMKVFEMESVNGVPISDKRVLRDRSYLIDTIPELESPNTFVRLRVATPLDILDGELPPDIDEGDILPPPDVDDEEANGGANEDEGGANEDDEIPPPDDPPPPIPLEPLVIDLIEIDSDECYINNEEYCSNITTLLNRFVYLYNQRVKKRYELLNHNFTPRHLDTPDNDLTPNERAEKFADLLYQSRLNNYLRDMELHLYFEANTASSITMLSSEPILLIAADPTMQYVTGIYDDNIATSIPRDLDRLVEWCFDNIVLLTFTNFNPESVRSLIHEATSINVIPLGVTYELPSEVDMRLDEVPPLMDIPIDPSLIPDQYKLSRERVNNYDRDMILGLLDTPKPSTPTPDDDKKDEPNTDTPSGGNQDNSSEGNQDTSNEGKPNPDNPNDNPLHDHYRLKIHYSYRVKATPFTSLTPVLYLTCNVGSGCYITNSSRTQSRRIVMKLNNSFMGGSTLVYPNGDFTTIIRSNDLSDLEFLLIDAYGYSVDLYSPMYITIHIDAIPDELPPISEYLETLTKGVGRGKGGGGGSFHSKLINQDLKGTPEAPPVIDDSEIPQLREQLLEIEEKKQPFLQMKRDLDEMIAHLKENDIARERNESDLQLLERKAASLDKPYGAFHKLQPKINKLQKEIDTLTRKIDEKNRDIQSYLDDNRDESITENRKEFNLKMIEELLPQRDDLEMNLANTRRKLEPIEGDWVRFKEGREALYAPINEAKAKLLSERDDITTARKEIEERYEALTKKIDSSHEEYEEIITIEKQLTLKLNEHLLLHVGNDRLLPHIYKMVLLHPELVGDKILPLDSISDIDNDLREQLEMMYHDNELPPFETIQEREMDIYNFLHNDSSNSFLLEKEMDEMNAVFFNQEVNSIMNRVARIHREMEAELNRMEIEFDIARGEDMDGFTLINSDTPLPILQDHMRNYQEYLYLNEEIPDEIDEAIDINDYNTIIINNNDRCYYHPTLGKISAPSRDINPQNTLIIEEEEENDLSNSFIQREKALLPPSKSEDNPIETMMEMDIDETPRIKIAYPLNISEDDEPPLKLIKSHIPNELLMNEDGKVMKGILSYSSNDEPINANTTVTSNDITSNVNHLSTIHDSISSPPHPSTEVTSNHRIPPPPSESSSYSNNDNHSNDNSNSFASSFIEEESNSFSPQE